MVPHFSWDEESTVLSLNVTQIDSIKVFAEHYEK